MYKILKTRMVLDKSQYRLIKLMSQISKNIYNIALYELRQHYFKTKAILSYLQIKELIKANPNVKVMHPYVTASIINDAIKAITLYDKYHEYDGSVKKYYAKNKLACNYKFPKYKKKNSFFTFSIVINDLVKNNSKQFYTIPMSYHMLNGYIFNHRYNDDLLDKFISQSHLKAIPKLEIILPRNLYKKTIKSVKIVPKANGRAFELQYLYEIPNPKYKYKGKEDMAIDLGVANLATCITTNLDSFIIDGKNARSIIRLYNKKIARAKAKLPFIAKTNKTRQLYYSKHVDNIYLRFESKMYDYIHKAVNKLLDRAIKDDVGRIILGWNDGFKISGFKDENKTNKILAHINQSFLELPLGKFRDTLAHKAKDLNIDIIIVDEKFTSKVSFYDDEPLNYHTYWGERIERGLFKRPNGHIVNADINAALNIYRKFITERSTNRDKLNILMCRGVLTPDRVRVLNYA